MNLQEKLEIIDCILHLNFIERNRREDVTVFVNIDGDDIRLDIFQEPRTYHLEPLTKWSKWSKNNEIVTYRKKESNFV